MLKRHLLTVFSALFMLMGLVVVTEGFRDLPLGNRPEWMVWETVLWPIVGIGLVEMVRLINLARRGFKLSPNRGRLLVHGIPALAISVLPPGTFTVWFGAGSPGSLLDFPTAKVMAALWLATTLWSGWEVTS